MADGSLCRRGVQDLHVFSHHGDNVLLFYKQVVDDVGDAAGAEEASSLVFDAAANPPEDVQQSWYFVRAVVKLCVLSLAGLGARHMSLKQKIHRHWHTVRLQVLSH